MIWVSWSEYTDRGGKPMVYFAGGHYPQKEALLIAREILALLSEDETNG